MIKLSINVTKITKDRIKPGKNGKYLGLVLFERADDYGNDGFVAEDVTKEEREQGIKGAIIGNWKDMSKKREEKPPRQQPPPSDDSDEVPF